MSKVGIALVAIIGLSACDDSINRQGQIRVFEGCKYNTTRTADDCWKLAEEMYPSAKEDCPDAD